MTASMHKIGATAVVPFTERQRAKFLARLVVTADPNECWGWTGNTLPGKYAEYGRFSMWDRVAKRIHNAPSHRVAYTMFVGPIPPAGESGVGGGAREHQRNAPRRTGAAWPAVRRRMDVVPRERAQADRLADRGPRRRTTTPGEAVRKIQWLTTAPNPRAISHSADAGQRGWRVHAVFASDKETSEEIRTRRAACGLRPSHGWDVDLFIEERCSKCSTALSQPMRRARFAQRLLRRDGKPDRRVSLFERCAHGHLDRPIGSVGIQAMEDAVRAGRWSHAPALWRDGDDYAYEHWHREEEDPLP